MAVYTHLDDGALRALWSVYDDDAELVRTEGIPHGSINTTYRLTSRSSSSAEAVFYLRINEDKTTDEVVYERDLLDRLAASNLGGIVTPVIRRTRIGGSFFLVERRAGRPVWAAIFDELPGRDLGPFEVTPAHTGQIGAFLARAHAALRAFRGGRANPFGKATVARWLRGIAAVPALADVAARLSAVLATVSAGRGLLPHGVVHGDLFIDNTKWAQGDLRAVFDWEMAGRDHLALDIAVCLNAWCWRREEGAFDAERARALVDGYQRVRPFHKSERRGLFLEALLAAVRFTASRLRDFEVPRERAHADRTYLDYRDFLARVGALQSLGARGFQRMVGIA